ncbi:ParB/RepB/Spo0J family partition protein [Streptomyces nojiriensis]|uniref:ParB/RepB/Spo0J family partition protein n=1 Tax=Streptomyces nojiriensis TaxID=66374 RepID=UPI0035DBBFBE
MQRDTRSEPLAVRPVELAHNPFNPRDELGDIEEMAGSLRSKGQIHPVTVVRRAAFLAVHAGQERGLGEAAYVVVDGNRRLAAARVAELDELRIDIRDELAQSSEDILESALITSIHRAGLGPLEEANAIRRLVVAYGSQRKVAERLGKSPAWISQRLALLKLADDLKDKVRSGELPVKEARRIGGLPPERQHAEAEKAMNRPKSPRRAVTPAVTGVVERINPVNPVDPVEAFAEYVERAVDFAYGMRDIAAAYRLAATADQATADRLVATLRERLDRVARHLPDSGTPGAHPGDRVPPGVRHTS